MLYDSCHRLIVRGFSLQRIKYTCEPLSPCTDNAQGAQWYAINVLYNVIFLIGADLKEQLT